MLIFYVFFCVFLTRYSYLINIIQCVITKRITILQQSVCVGQSASDSTSVSTSKKSDGEFFRHSSVESVSTLNYFRHSIRLSIIYYTIINILICFITFYSYSSHIKKTLGKSCYIITLLTILSDYSILHTQNSRNRANATSLSKSWRIVFQSPYCHSSEF